MSGTGNYIYDAGTLARPIRYGGIDAYSSRLPLIYPDYFSSNPREDNMCRITRQCLTIEPERVSSTILLCSDVGNSAGSGAVPYSLKILLDSSRKASMYRAMLASGLRSPT